MDPRKSADTEIVVDDAQHHEQFQIWYYGQGSSRNNTYNTNLVTATLTNQIRTNAAPQQGQTRTCYTQPLRHAQGERGGGREVERAEIKRARTNPIPGN